MNYGSQASGDINRLEKERKKELPEATGQFVDCVWCQNVLRLGLGFPV